MNSDRQPPATVGSIHIAAVDNSENDSNGDMTEYTSDGSEEAPPRTMSSAVKAWFVTVTELIKTAEHEPNLAYGDIDTQDVVKKIDVERVRMLSHQTFLRYVCTEALDWYNPTAPHDPFWARVLSIAPPDHNQLPDGFEWYPAIKGITETLTLVEEVWSRDLTGLQIELTGGVTFAASPKGIGNLGTMSISMGFWCAANDFLASNSQYMVWLESDFIPECDILTRITNSRICDGDVDFICLNDAMWDVLVNNESSAFDGKRNAQWCSETPSVVQNEIAHMARHICDMRPHTGDDGTKWLKGNRMPWQTAFHAVAFSRSFITLFLDWVSTTKPFENLKLGVPYGIDEVVIQFLDCSQRSIALALPTKIKEYGTANPEQCPSGTFHATSVFGALNAELPYVNAGSEKVALRDICV